MMHLIDRRTDDGSRHFASLPHICEWGALCEHISQLPGAEVTSFVHGGLGDAWIDFVYAGHRFVVSQRGGAFCFLVRDPVCPDLNLYQVACHCEKLLTNA